MNLPRCSGLLLHVSSLPGPYGIGDLGAAAYRFADLLHDAEQRLWQVLPLVPVGHGHSPYASPSTFAGNPLFISLEELRRRRLLDEDDLAGAPDFPEGRVDYERVIPFRFEMLRRAFARFEAGEGTVDRGAVERFREEHTYWLDDYALFMALKKAHDDAAWTDWPAPLARREPDALDDARGGYDEEIRRHVFWQYLFFEQLQALRAYCHERDIRLFGDLPIYVAHDSADVWAHRDLFHLDRHGQPTVVAGVPPDYFSETGQRWGNPIYRWDVMRENRYAWWTHRLAHTLELVDVIRLDHFRGFAAYWAIPAEEETAVHGEWVDGPGDGLFETVRAALGELPLVAEDLGLITPDVKALMRRFDLPGMAVAQFAFGGDADNTYLPHNHERRLVAYTGTHDNDTVRGWWEGLRRAGDPDGVLRHAREYLGLDGDEDADSWTFIRLVMMSVADVAVVPVQDVLGLGGEARMNTPGLGTGNWTWRLAPGMLDARSVAPRLRALTRLYGRAPEE